MKYSLQSIEQTICIKCQTQTISFQKFILLLNGLIRRVQMLNSVLYSKLRLLRLPFKWYITALYQSIMLAVKYYEQFKIDDSHKEMTNLSHKKSTCKFHLKSLQIFKNIHEFWNLFLMIPRKSSTLIRCFKLGKGSSWIEGSTHFSWRNTRQKSF